MEKGGSVKAAAAAGPMEEAVAGLAAALPSPAPTPTCYKKTVGEGATIVEVAKDYYSQFKENTTEKHWTCIKNKVRAAGEYVSQKSSSVFGKQKVEPVVKDGDPEAAQPVPAAVESH